MPLISFFSFVKKKNVPGIFFYYVGSMKMFLLIAVLKCHLYEEGYFNRKFKSYRHTCFKNADKVYEEARALISAIGLYNFILSSGCSIPAIAPPENIEAMVRAAKGE